MSVDLSQFHQVFFEESFENLDAMETQLMALDPSQLDDETINSIFRAAHSIKGGAGTFGFSSVADFTHLLETLLDETRSGTRGIDQDEIDLFLQSVDWLREMLQACQQETDIDTVRTQELCDQFRQLLDLSPEVENLESTSREENPGNSNKRWSIRFAPNSDLLSSGNEPLRMFRVLSESCCLSAKVVVNNIPEFELMAPEQCYLAWQLTLDGDVTREQIDEVFEWVVDQAEIDIHQVFCESPEIMGKTWDITFSPERKILLSGNDPLKLLRELTDLGQCDIKVDPHDFPAFESFHPEECYLSWTIVLRADCEQQDIRRIFEWVEDEASINIHCRERSLSDSTQDNVASHGASEKEVTVASKSTTVSENIVNKKPKSKMESSSIRVAIDKIDNLINMVGELVITQSMLGQIGNDFSLDKLPRLQEGLSQLDHNTRELQESVMRIRMLPISFAFSRFPRMVRDLSRRLDKQMELVLTGEQTELDKTVMERIGDPLVHLVRNAIDHGIENPAERVALGKPAQGTINLNAYHQSGNVVIEIADDGRGINRNKLLDKARTQGLVSADDGVGMTDSQVYDLIFHPGLSTATEVSDVSGRGVGMDVVKRNIQELNGSVEIKSEENVGTRIVVRLPLTLAILDGQLVRVGSNVYIFPLVSIVESMQVKNQQLCKVAGGCEVFPLRDEYVPVVRLHEIFGVEPDSVNIEDSILVVVEADGEKTGVVVDELSSQQQVVIKSLEQNYQRIEGVSGATILGDGTVSLILDVPGLVSIAGVCHLATNQMLRHSGLASSQALN